MRGKTLVIFVVLAMVALIGTRGGVVAEPPAQGGGDVQVAGVVSSKISYQGQLTDSGGNPLSGSYNLKFELYTALSGGSKLWEQTRNGVQVQNGLFTVELNVNNGDFNGQGMWLAITVNGQGLSPRQEVLAAPYALSLRPGAQITASIYDGAVLRLENTDASNGGGYALSAINASGNTWRPAIYGENKGASAGVLGSSAGWHAVVGWQTGSNVANAGVYGHNNGAGVGVKGESATGYGVAAYSGGAWMDHAALYAENTHPTQGMAAFMKNNSGFHTAHFQNDGTGGVLYLKNHGDQNGTGGNDFITAVSGTGDGQFRVTSSGQARSDVGFTTPAEDFAEMVPAAGDLEPGDVLAIGADGKLTRSSEPYQTSVAGVYSTQPGFLGGQPLDGDAAGSIPLAIVGIVPVKVSAENGTIAPGDLLVASSLPGHAMKAGANAPQGSVIGKAMEALQTGTGVVKMLATLQ